MRGLLCNQCNLGISHLQDDPGVIRAAIDYLSGRPQAQGDDSSASREGIIPFQLARISVGLMIDLLFYVNLLYMALLAGFWPTFVNTPENICKAKVLKQEFPKFLSVNHQRV